MVAPTLQNTRPQDPGLPNSFQYYLSNLYAAHNSALLLTQSTLDLLGLTDTQGLRGCAGSDPHLIPSPDLGQNGQDA